MTLEELQALTTIQASKNLEFLQEVEDEYYKALQEAMPLCEETAKAYIGKCFRGVNNKTNFVRLEGTKVYPGEVHFTGTSLFLPEAIDYGITNLVIQQGVLYSFDNIIYRKNLKDYIEITADEFETALNAVTNALETAEQALRAIN